MLYDRFVCPPAEYEFAQYFSMAGRSSKGNKNNAYIGYFIMPIVWIIGFIVFIIGANVFPRYFSVFELLNGMTILMGIAVGGFIFIRKAYYTSNLNISVDKNVPQFEYLIINKKGIGINLYNNLADDVLPFFEWKDINTLHLGYTRDLQTVFAERSYGHVREAYIKKLNLKYHHVTPFDDQAVYFDRYTLIINKDYGVKMNTAYIQIPHSWMDNGRFNRLMQLLRAYFTFEIEPYARYQEPVHILERLLQ